VAGELLFRQSEAHDQHLYFTISTYIKDAGNLLLQKASRHTELSSACADDHKTCIFAQFGSCHENVTQIAENGGKSAANGNK
jgi:hypothetical protein